MKLLSKFIKTIYFLLCVIDIFRKHAWIVPLKDKNGITITDDFQEILDESGSKPNNTWADKGSKFCNKLLKSWLEENDIEMYSIHKEGKSVIVERFVRILKNKIYKCMTSISQNV